MHPPIRVFGLGFLAALIAITTQAEPNTFWIKVLNLKDRPVRKITVAAEGSSSSALTDDRGLARVILSPQTKPGTWVSLRVSGDDYAFISPWDSKVLVPSLMSESGSFVTI